MTEVAARPAEPRIGAATLLCMVLVGLAGLIQLDAERFADPDLFVTLYAGRDIVARGGVPGVDTVSFSVAGLPWRDYEWLARVALYAVNSALGSAGLVLARLGLGALLLGSLLAMALRRERWRGFSFALAVILGAPAFYRFFLFRPTLFTFALLAMLLGWVDLVRRGRRWPLWAFPALMVLWVNLHAGFALGVAVVGMLFAESVAGAIFAAIARRWRARGDAAPPGGTAARVPVAAAGASLLASIAASGLNPFGYHNWLAVLGTIGGKFTPEISEWKPMSHYGLFHYLPVLLLGALLLIVLVLSRRRVGVFDVCLAGSLLVAAILRVRFVPLFAIAAASLVVRLFPERPDLFTRLFPGGPARLPRAAGPVAAAVLVLAAWLHTGHPDREIQIAEHLTPVAAVKFMEANSMTGPSNVFSEYDWGGYLRYRMPAVRIFVDGRSDTVYPHAIVTEWAGFVSGRPEAYGVPERYGARFILLGREQPVVRRLERDPRWFGAYADDFSSLFLLDCEENRQYIERLAHGEGRPPALSAADYLLD